MLDHLIVSDIEKYYAYTEERTINKIFFGWTQSKKISPPLVVTSPVLGGEWEEWSRKEGVSGASLDDYKKYFKSLTGMHSQKFVSAWPDRKQYLEIWKNQNSEQPIMKAELIYDLSQLLELDKRFEWGGRKFQIIR